MPADGWSFGYESEPEPRPYFTASGAQLCTAAVVMQLREEGSLRLDSPLGRFFDGDLLAGLHVHRGVDHGEAITVRHLLANTSGLPGYLMERRHDGGTVIGDALIRDRGWTFDQALSVVRNTMRPRFRPGAHRRAHSSETDYALLGRIIEVITGGPWERAVTERIIGPLGLSGTWPFTLADVERYDEVAAMRHGGDVARIPLTMASVKAQGGLVSTADDGVVFLRALLGGQLFDPAYVDEMTAQWRRVSGSLWCGLGPMRFRIARPGVFGGPRDCIGHAGASGSMLFHVPAAGLYVSGALNQIDNDRLARQLAARLAAVVTAAPIISGE